MKTLTQSNWRFLPLIIVILFASCKKGDTGSKGDKGDKGEQGTKGDKGDNGSPGTANVFYSDWIQPTNGMWNIRNTSQFKIMQVHDTKITADIINKGALFVFKKNNLNQVTQLPRSVVNSSNGILLLTETVSTAFVGSFQIILQSYNERIPNYEFIYEITDGNTKTFNAQYRYIIIPGGVAISSKSSSTTTLNSTYDYETLKHMYHIPD